MAPENQYRAALSVSIYRKEEDFVYRRVEALMSQHLTTTQITLLLERQTAPDELEFITDHLADCAACRQQVRDAQHASERIAYLRTTLLINEAAAESATETSWQRLVSGLRHWQLWRPLPLAAMLCALLLAGAGWMLLRKPDSTSTTNASQTAPERTVTPSASLNPSPSVTASPAKILAAIYDNGQQVTLDESGQLTGLPAISISQQQIVRQALLNQRLTLPQELRSARNKAGRLMGDNDSQPRLLLRRPLGTWVRETRPQLCWQAVPGALRYVVKILDTNFNLVTASEAITDNCWQPPQPLTRNRTYLWQVTAETANAVINSTSAELTEARFKIISVEQASEIERAARNYSPSHLTLGTLYAQAGLLTEAQREFRLLLKANPRSTIARHLLNQVSR